VTKPISLWLAAIIGSGAILVPQPVHALDPSLSLFQYNCQNWTRQSGLPVNGIRAITQSRDGYLWLGTQKGLVQFDGLNFLLIAPPNNPAWRSQSITTLSSNTRGGLWFGVDEGSFGLFDGQKSFSCPTDDWLTPRVNAHSILEAADGSIWLSSGDGLAHWDGTTNLPSLNRSGWNVQSLHEDSQRRVWIGSVQDGLFYWDSGTIHTFPDLSLTNCTIHAIATDREGGIWVGTTTGLRRYDRNFEPNEATPIYTEVRALRQDRHGAMWIGTSGDGLIRHLNGQMSSLHRTNGLVNNFVNVLHEDHEGSLWVGTREGLSQISDVKFPIFSAAEGLLGGSVHGLCPSTNGGIWVASSRGICNFDGVAASSFTQAAGLSSAYIKRVLEARDGDVYLLNGNREVEVFSGGRIVARHSNGEWPVALAEDAQGVVVSIGANLFRVNRAEMVPLIFNGAAPDFYWIRNLFSCSDGALLVASVNGVFRIGGSRAGHWAEAEGLPDYDVNWVCEDRDKTIWAGQPTGITRIKGDKAVAIRTELINTAVTAIVPDDWGNLWVASPRGIIRVTRKSLNDVADGRASTVEGVVYDGLEAVKTIDTTEVEYVGFKTSDGRIWFPSPQGPIRIDPARIPINLMPPPVHIQKVFANGIEQLVNGAPNVRRGKGELAFQYTALSYLSPQKLRFRYKLEGYDPDWIDAGTRRSAFYANLKPRHYTFHVQACNADGIWNTSGHSVEIALLPHFYQTAWFQILIGLSIALALFGVYRWRVRHLRHKEETLRAMNDLLEIKIGERTQELADQRNLLRTLIDHLPDEIFVKDTKGRVIIDNMAHARALGVQNPDEAVGKTDFDCFPADKASQFRRTELIMLNSGQEYNGEESILMPDGRTRWHRTTKVPLRDSKNEIIGLAGIHRDITERKKWEAELESLHKQLVETSRHAGMAEVATSVLHNVGNVLNSVNISASIVEDQVRNSALDRFSKVLALLREHSNDLGHFLTQDEKGTKLVGYMDALFRTMTKENERIQEETGSLTKNVEHIKKIVSMQQSYARVAGITEVIEPAELLEDSLRMHEAAFHRHGIQLVREYSDVPMISVDRHKVIQILVNLLQNAKYACDVNDVSDRIVRVCIDAPAPDRIRIEVIDNGMGIAAENVNRIFTHGFTTRKNGHGFGLHSGALAAREMGGSLVVHSDGVGEGARFTLELPLEQKPVSKPGPDRSKIVSEIRQIAALNS
jgi:PAS domain S-box-containing protein